MPEVGIFWLIDNKLVADSIPWRQADIYGGFYSGKNDHATFWATLQRLMPQWKGNEYTDFPRGWRTGTPSSSGRELLFINCNVTYLI
jgi:hypothetical protein